MLSQHLQRGFHNPVGVDEQQFNERMSRVRVSVEWSFGEIIEKYRFTDFKKMMKTGLSPVAKQYAVSTIFQNAHNCIYPAKCSQTFECPPPVLEDYFLARRDEQ